MKNIHDVNIAHALRTSQIARFIGSTWGPPGSCWPQVGPMLSPWILLSGVRMNMRHAFKNITSTSNKHQFLINLNIGTCNIHTQLHNSLWPSDAIWRHRSWSTLAQVMTGCLMAPSHYLNQCWLIINEVIWPEGYFIAKYSTYLPLIWVWILLP